VRGDPRFAVDQRADDRALDQDLELAGEHRRLRRGGRLGQLLEQLAHGLAVAGDGGVAGRAAAVRDDPGQRGRQGGGVRLLAAQPGLQGVPERQQPRPRRTVAVDLQPEPAEQQLARPLQVGRSAVVVHHRGAREPAPPGLRPSPPGRRQSAL
jgi:hypothetical protein